MTKPGCVQHDCDKCRENENLQNAVMRFFEAYDKEEPDQGEVASALDDLRLAAQQS